MKEFALDEISINDAFWDSRVRDNAESAIFFQWEMLEATNCIDNFRIAANMKTGFRKGFFYSDSDATKWLDAASRIMVSYPSDKLKQIIDEFIQTLEKVQTNDGYLFTYNQILFPEVRWKNIQVEHELYSHGHLIEGAPFHLLATKDRSLMDLAEKAASLINSDFREKRRVIAPGHQEIEIALMRLYRSTKNISYLELAEYFLKNRGKSFGFGFRFLKQTVSTGLRMSKVEKLKKKYLKAHPDEKITRLPDHVKLDMPKGIILRSLHMFTSGKYNQQHKPIEKQTVPEGHSVRFLYQQTAAAMLCREKPNEELKSALIKSWDHMVQKRMFATGGIGSIPIIEGFGYDYELNPYYAYCETCAGIGSVLWNWEMICLTHEPKYADLLEWQLYNAVSPGISIKGDSYLYRNPLISKGKVKREKWFATPCCPSNISRVFASLGQYVFSVKGDCVYVHQYIGTSMKNVKGNIPLQIDLVSNYPYDTSAKITVRKAENPQSTIMIRVPSWTNSVSVKINGKTYITKDLGSEHDSEINVGVETASGLNPYLSYYLPIKPGNDGWKVNDVIDISFSNPIVLLIPHPKAKAIKNMFAIARGPIIYCAESIDNENIDILKEKIVETSVRVSEIKAFDGNATLLECDTKSGKVVKLIPYHLWGNRGISQMTVYFKRS